MIKKLVIAALAIGLASLAGCSAFNAAEATTISPQAVQTADSAVDLAISSATAYIELPVCSSIVTAPCRTLTASTALYKDVVAAQTARTNLKALLRANNGAAIPIASYNTIKAVFDTLETDVALYAGK